MPWPFQNHTTCIEEGVCAELRGDTLKSKKENNFLKIWYFNLKVSDAPLRHSELETVGLGFAFRSPLIPSCLRCPCLLRSLALHPPQEDQEVEPWREEKDRTSSWAELRGAAGLRQGFDRRKAWRWWAAKKMVKASITLGALFLSSRAENCERITFETVRAMLSKLPSATGKTRWCFNL